MTQQASDMRDESPPTVPFMRFLIGRYRCGRWLEKWSIKRVGISPISLQVAFFRRRPYPSTLLLTTIGRKTGELREAPLPYLVVDDDFVVVGSLAGGPRNPSWVANLQSDPRCWVHVKRRFQPATARILSGAERQAFLERCIADRPIVREYDEGAASHGREMPIVALRPNRYSTTNRDKGTEGR